MALRVPECGQGEHLLPTDGGQLPPLIPSNINVWRARRVAGSRYTRMQLEELERLGISETAAEDVVVVQAISDREMWAPIGSRPVYLIPCPIVGRRVSAGREQLKVISPRRDPKWVYADPKRPGFAFIRRGER